MTNEESAEKLARAHYKMGSSRERGLIKLVTAALNEAEERGYDDGLWADERSRRIRND